MSKLYQEPSVGAQILLKEHCEELEESSRYQKVADLETRYVHSIFNLRFEMPDRQNDRFFDNWFKAWQIANVQRGQGIFIVLAVMNFGGCIFLLYENTGNMFDPFMLLVVGLLCIASALISVFWVDISPTRYNRQAQLVHMYIRPKWNMKPVLVTVPWKSVRVFMQEDIGNIFSPARLHLIYPGQPEKFGHEEPIVMYRSELCNSHTGSVGWCYSSYEIIRRYMEMGIDAVQDYDTPEKHITRIESGLGSKGSIDLAIDIFGLGIPRLIDKIMKKRRESFRWPEEVEALCAPDAREKGLLDIYDTESVKAVRNVNVNQTWSGVFEERVLVRDRYLDQQQGIPEPVREVGS